MELRRGPPAVRKPEDEPTTIHVLNESPRARAVAPARWRRLGAIDSYFVRVLAAALALTIPIGVLLGFFQLGAALERAGDRREARRAFAAAGLALMRSNGDVDLTTLEGYTGRDLGRAIAIKLTSEHGRDET